MKNLEHLRLIASRVIVTDPRFRKQIEEWTCAINNRVLVKPIFCGGLWISSDRGLRARLPYPQFCISGTIRIASGEYFFKRIKSLNRISSKIIAARIVRR